MVEPVIKDNTGQVAVSEETIYNIDVFNSHAVTEEHEDKGEGGCDTSCAHYFSGLEVGELISFILLGCLFAYNWGQISLWCHAQCTKWRTSSQAAKVAKTERKRQTLKLELEAERAAELATKAELSGPNQTFRMGATASVQHAGGVQAATVQQGAVQQAGGVQAAKKPECVAVEF